MQTALKIKLSLFMFLQHFIWGYWQFSMAMFLGKTLGFEGGQIGLPLARSRSERWFPRFFWFDCRPLFRF